MKAFERLPRSCRSGGTDVGKAGGTPGEVVMLTWLARVYSGSSSGMQADQSPRIRRALEVAIVCKAVPSHSGFLWLWQTSTSSRSSSRQPATSAQSTRGRQVSEGARVVEVGRGWGASERVSSVKLWAQGCALGMPSKCFTPIIASNIQLFIPIHTHFIRSKQILLTTLRRPRSNRVGRAKQINGLDRKIWPIFVLLGAARVKAVAPLGHVPSPKRLNLSSLRP